MKKTKTRDKYNDLDTSDLKKRERYERKEKYRDYLSYEDEEFDDYEDVYEHGSKSEMRGFVNHLHHPKG